MMTIVILTINIYHVVYGGKYCDFKKDHGK